MLHEVEQIALNKRSKFQMFSLISGYHIGAPSQSTNAAFPYLANLREAVKLGSH